MKKSFTTITLLLFFGLSLIAQSINKKEIEEKMKSSNINKSLKFDSYVIDFDKIGTEDGDPVCALRFKNITNQNISINRVFTSTPGIMANTINKNLKPDEESFFYVCVRTKDIGQKRKSFAVITNRDTIRISVLYYGVAGNIPNAREKTIYKTPMIYERVNNGPTELQLLAYIIANNGRLDGSLPSLSNNSSQEKSDQNLPCKIEIVKSGKLNSGRPYYDTKISNGKNSIDYDFYFNEASSNWKYKKGYYELREFSGIDEVFLGETLEEAKEKILEICCKELNK